MSADRGNHLIRLQPEDSAALANFCGQFDEHLKLIEERTGVRVSSRGFTLELEGELAQLRPVKELLEKLYRDAINGLPLSPAEVHLGMPLMVYRCRQPKCI